MRRLIARNYLNSDREIMENEFLLATQLEIVKSQAIHAIYEQLDDILYPLVIQIQDNDDSSIRFKIINLIFSFFGCKSPCNNFEEVAASGVPKLYRAITEFSLTFVKNYLEWTKEFRTDVVEQDVDNNITSNDVNILKALRNLFHNKKGIAEAVFKSKRWEQYNSSSRADSLRNNINDEERVKKTVVDLLMPCVKEFLAFDNPDVHFDTDNVSELRKGLMTVVSEDYNNILSDIKQNLDIQQIPVACTNIHKEYSGKSQEFYDEFISNNNCGSEEDVENYFMSIIYNQMLDVNNDIVSNELNNVKSGLIHDLAVQCWNNSLGIDDYLFNVVKNKYAQALRNAMDDEAFYAELSDDTCDIQSFKNDNAVKNILHKCLIEAQEESELPIQDVINYYNIAHTKKMSHLKRTISGTTTRLFNMHKNDF